MRQRSYCTGFNVGSSPSSSAACQGQRGLNSIVRARRTRSALPFCRIDFGLARIGDQTDGDGRHAGLAADALGEGTWYPGRTSIFCSGTAPPLDAVM